MNNKEENLTNQTLEKIKKDLYVDKSSVKDFNPYYKKVQSALTNRVLVESNSLISLGTNDYLGLANNSQVKKATSRVLDLYGVSLCGTPIVIGQSDINSALEKDLAKFLKQEDSLIFSSCYQANIGVFMMLADKDDIIIADREIHSSLLSGISLSRARFRMFPHNDLEKLENILKRSNSYNKKLIVVEGLYSTNGDVANLSEIINLANKYDAFVIVDDAHGVGVLGEEGRGILELCNAFHVDLVTGSFGKAIGTFGGFIAGDNEIIDGLRYKLATYFYSTALPPMIAAATRECLKLIPNMKSERKKIFDYGKLLYCELKKLGFNLTDTTTPLISVLFDTPEKTFEMTRLLYDNNIYVVPFVPPSVAKDGSRIRLTLNANLTDEDIETVIKIFKKIASENSELLK